jgi:NAD(P)H-flavin reductase
VALLTVPLSRVEAASSRLRLLTLDMVGHAFAYAAGQAVYVGAHRDADRKPFSIACSPERAADTHTLELLIAMESADALPWAHPGALVDVEGPLGSFTMPAAFEQRRVLFVAGGTGIAPVRAMLDHVLRRDPSRKISVLYSTRRSDEFAFIGELRAHADAGRIELHQTVTRDETGSSWEGGRGRIGRSHFETVLHDPASTLCFVCGPPAMVSDSAATLRDLGVPSASIRTEGWSASRQE